MKALRTGPDPRILVVTSATHGHHTWGDALRRAFLRIDEPIDHASFRRNDLNRLASVPVPGLREWDVPAMRRQWANDLQLRRFARWAMNRYEVVHVMAAGLAHPFAQVGGAARLSVGLDCTAELMRDELDSNPFQERLRAATERTTFGAADHLASMSEWAAASVMRTGVAGPVLVVRPSGAVADAPPAPPADGEPLRVAFVGTGWHRKGGDRLLRAWADLQPGSAELHLVGRDVPDTAAFVAGVVVHRAMAREEVVGSLLPSCHLFVHPTRRDQSSWAIAEALCAGLPVVATAIGGVSELIADGRTGCLVAPGDDAGLVAAIDGLLNDSAARRSMAAAALLDAGDRLDEVENFDRLAAALVALSPRPG